MPPRVAVLPDAVVDQIAAGEVVERPASVVKELLENALDAGATSVELEITEGGRSRIRVADDGCGMSREDALLALQRHATSKIRDASDLVGVESFGFRGEALPAIASVSHLELETATEHGAGTRIRCIAGEVTAVDDIARRHGTTVIVSRLFFNTPARQKFLRSARSEWRSIVDITTSLSFVRGDVRLALTHDGRAVATLPSSDSLRSRIAAAWGTAFAERLLVVEDVSGPMHVAGLVERPADVGTAGRRVFLAANGRAIRDAGLVRAAEAAYRSTIPAGLRPSLFLHIVMPGDALDVNVHPTKAEVRFRDRWTTERAVEQAVRRSLGTIDSAASLGPRSWFIPAPPARTAVDIDALQRTRPESEVTLLDAGAPNADSSPPAGLSEADVPPLVQLRRTYLMFERDDGVVLIDQHSAHERVLYERFMRTLECGAAPAQRLLFPLTLHLGPAEGEAFEENRDLFLRLGFEIEGFGGHTLIVAAVPMPHPRFDAERCLRDTLDALTGDRLAGTAARHERLAATLACKSAIKAGDGLAPDEMRALFASLANCSLPAHDVHGRSTIVQLSWDEVERRFGRR
jgi:DNA mismatch repair protein MutL